MLAIPDDPRAWDVPGVRSAERLAVTLHAGREVAERFKTLATLRTDAAVGAVDDWQWRGPAGDAPKWAERFDSPALLARVEKLASRRA